MLARSCKANKKNTAASKKRKVDIKPHKTLAVAPIQIDVTAAERWRDRLAAASTAPDPTVDADLASVASRTGSTAERAWATRLDLEAKKVTAMLKGLVDGNLVGVLKHNAAGERLSVFYESIGQSDWFKGVAPVTRHIVTGRHLLELDITGAHPAVAWSALVCQLDTETANRTCPVLHKLVTDRDAFVSGLVADGYFNDAANGKTMLLAALNQEPRDDAPPGDPVNRLRRERATMTAALLAFPPLADVVAEIHLKAEAAKGGVSLLSLAMQAGETAALEAAIPELAESGWAAAAPIGDALLLTRTRPSACSAESARRIMIEAARSIGCGLMVKIDHVPV